MYEERIFKGTRADFIAFLESFVEKRHFAGYSSKCPSFSLVHPKNEPINDGTKRIKLNFWMYLNNCHPTSIIATKLPNNFTLLTGRVLHGKYGTPLDMKDPAISYSWQQLIASLKEQGWLEETSSGTEKSKNSETQITIQGLWKKINRHFNQEELNNIGFELDIDLENLSASGRENQARELVLLIQRQNRNLELIEIVKKLRPKVVWEVE